LHEALTVSSSTEDWEVLGLDKKLDAAGGAGGAPDEADAFESEHHLMHAGRRDLEVTLHVSFRGRSAKDPAVGVDEGEVLTLLLSERGLGHASGERQTCKIELKSKFAPGGFWPMRSVLSSGK
jgi:hypothetical protein